MEPIDALKPEEVALLKSKTLEALDSARRMLKQLEDDIAASAEAPNLDIMMHRIATAFCNYSQSAASLEKHGIVQLAVFLRSRVRSPGAYERLLNSL